METISLLPQCRACRSSGTKPLPLVFTTASANPTIPGAILVNLPNSGNLTDEWQTQPQRQWGRAQPSALDRYS